MKALDPIIADFIATEERDREAKSWETTQTTRTFFRIFVHSGGLGMSRDFAERDDMEQRARLWCKTVAKRGVECELYRVEETTTKTRLL